MFGTSDDDLVDAGILARRQYPRAGGTVTVYEYVPRPLIPPAQQPGGSADDEAFYAALGEYLPALGPAQRAHLIETARMMVNAALQRGQTPSASPRASAGAADSGSGR